MFCSLNMNIGSSRADACFALLTNICHLDWDDFNSGLLATAVATRLVRSSAGNFTSSDHARAGEIDRSVSKTRVRRIFMGTPDCKLSMNVSLHRLCQMIS